MKTSKVMKLANTVKEDSETIVALHNKITEEEAKLETMLDDTIANQEVLSKEVTSLENKYQMPVILETSKNKFVCFDEDFSPMEVKLIRQTPKHRITRQQQRVLAKANCETMRQMRNKNTPWCEVASAVGWTGSKQARASRAKAYNYYWTNKKNILSAGKKTKSKSK